MRLAVLAGAAASLVTLAPIDAVAQVKQGMSSSYATVDLQVCNQSGRKATVAVSYVEVGSGRFINRGWYDVDVGACTSLVTTDNANFYLYGDASDGSGRTWAGDHPLCVQYPGPYTFWSDGGDTCPTGYETRNFVVMHADEAGTYTWNLDP